jgi:hypothetical protein
MDAAYRRKGCSSLGPAEVLGGIRITRKLATVGVCANRAAAEPPVTAALPDPPAATPGAQQAMGPRPVLSTTAPRSPALVASWESVSNP